MRRLAQFVRLRASRVCVCLASVVLSRVLSRVCLASVVLSRFCLASRVRLASASRVWLSLCVCVRLASRVCLRLFTSRVPNACVCVCLASASVSRRSSCLASVSRRSSCLASVSRLASVVLSRVCLSPCECLRGLAQFVRRSSFKEFKRFLLSSYYRCTYRLCRLYEQTFNILI